MDHEVFPLKSCGFNNTNVGLATPPSRAQSSHSFTLLIFLFIQSVMWPLGNAVDVLFNSVMVISIQVASWPSHCNIMISLGKVITKLLQVLTTLARGTIDSKILVISYSVLKCSWSMGPNLLPWLLPSNKIFLSDFCLPSNWCYFVFHRLQETCVLLINIKYTECVVQLNVRYIVCREPTRPVLRIFQLRPIT